jgi:hypothetical protein
VLTKVAGKIPSTANKCTAVRKVVQVQAPWKRNLRGFSPVQFILYDIISGTLDQEPEVGQGVVGSRAIMIFSGGKGPFQSATALLMRYVLTHPKR